MDFKIRRELYNRCNPNESLPPDDPRNVDFDNWGDRAHRVRGVDWVERLAARIELSNEPELELFAGLRGSGKSTELRRLEHCLSDSHRAHLLVVRIDAEQHLDLTVHRAR